MAYFFHIKVKTVETAFVLSETSISMVCTLDYTPERQKMQAFIVNGSLAMVLATFYIII